MLFRRDDKKYWQRHLLLEDRAANVLQVIPQLNVLWINVNIKHKKKQMKNAQNYVRTSNKKKYMNRVI